MLAFTEDHLSKAAIAEFRGMEIVHFTVTLSYFPSTRVTLIPFAEYQGVSMSFRVTLHREPVGVSSDFSKNLKHSFT